MRTYFSLYEGAPETARQAQAMSPDDGRFPTVRVWGDYFIGLSYLWEGRPILADQSIRQQHDRWERHVGRRGQWAAMLASLLAVACWQRDQRDDARALLAHRLDVIDQTTGPDGIEYLYRCLAQMAAAEGDDARAISYLEALAAMSVSCGLVRWRIVSLAERVRLHSVHQRPVQAASSLADLDAVFASQVLCTREQPLMHMELALARTYAALAERDMTRAGDCLGHAWTLARRLNRGCEIVQIMALQALLANRSHESPNSLLLEALSRAETGDLVRAFADTVPEVTGLVRQLAQHGNHYPISRSFIDRALAAADVTVAEATRPISKVASAILTPKEDEVLRLLAAGLPNKRIAAELGLSSETVKWHVKKLFAKLNAGSRDHAVERARMLGLIS
jgi:LuxR family maltose regulon positive regulatory protein